jgi:hypothetical protein
MTGPSFSRRAFMAGGVTALLTTKLRAQPAAVYSAHAFVDSVGVMRPASRRARRAIIPARRSIVSFRTRAEVLTRWMRRCEDGASPVASIPEQSPPSARHGRQRTDLNVGEGRSNYLP